MGMNWAIQALRCSTMEHEINHLTAEIETGREAIAEVMDYSFKEKLIDRLKKWSIARVVDGTPVSFMIIDPYRQMDFYSGKVRYAFIRDAATRKDRRNEGHFRGIMEYSFKKMKEKNIALAMTHGHSNLYRNRFGFNTFTYNQGLFVTPKEIEVTFGLSGEKESIKYFQILDNIYVHDDLLVITNIKAETQEECKRVLQQAAVVAREKGKNRILFEYPFSSESESFYPFYGNIDSPFMQLAEICGVRRVMQGASPENGHVSHGDWIKLLKPYEFLKTVIGLIRDLDVCVKGSINIIVDDSQVNIECSNDGIKVSKDQSKNAEKLECTSTDLIRLVTGYHSISELATINNYKLTEENMYFLDKLFPKSWRFSRNEDWTYKQ